jgi:chromosome partitioning protein
VSRVICIANRKGGVGKTTSAINIAACLGVEKEATLLIDCDPQGNATSGVGAHVTEEQGTLYEVLLGECSIPDAISKTAIESLDVLPATHDLIGVEVELLNTDNREYVLRTILAKARDNYKYILLDCPPSLGLLTVNALTAADSVLIPLQCEYYALEGLRSLLETIDLIRARLNPDLAIEGLLMTMSDPRNRLSRQVEEEVREFFPDQVFDTVVPRNVRLSESPSHGMPVILYDPSCRGAQSYKELVQEICQRSQKTQAATPPAASEDVETRGGRIDE